MAHREPADPRPARLEDAAASSVTAAAGQDRRSRSGRSPGHVASPQARPAPRPPAGTPRAWRRPAGSECHQAAARDHQVAGVLEVEARPRRARRRARRWSARGGASGAARGHSSRRKSATSSANSAGWVYRVSSEQAVGSRARRTSPRAAAGPGAASTSRDAADQRLAKAGYGLGQLPSHPGALAALPGEQEGHPPARRSPCAAHSAGRGLAAGERARPGADLAPVAADDRRAVVERRARRPASTPGRRRQVRSRSRAARPRGRPARPAPAGERAERARRSVRARPASAARSGRGLVLEDDVGVGAADAEGGDAGAARAARLGPRPRLGRAARPRRPSQSTWAEGSSSVQGPRQDAVPHRHDHLDDARRRRRRPGCGRCSTSPSRATAAVRPRSCP